MVSEVELMVKQATKVAGFMTYCVVLVYNYNRLSYIDNRLQFQFLVLYIILYIILRVRYLRLLYIFFSCFRKYRNNINLKYLLI